MSAADGYLIPPALWDQCIQNAARLEVSPLVGVDMNEPDYNTYQITVTVRDISKSAALELARAFDAKAQATPGKDFVRIADDVHVTVAHVKAETLD